MNILGRDKSFYGQYKFLTSHSIFIVSSNIYIYIGIIPATFLVVTSCASPSSSSMIFVRAIYIIFFIIITLFFLFRREFKRVFQTRLNVSQVADHLARYAKRFYSKKKRRKGRKEKASIFSLFERESRKKFREGEAKLQCFDSRVKLERR